MSIINVTKDNFEEVVLKSDIPVLVDFNASWCGPCRMLRPILDEVAGERTNFKIVSINIDDEEELSNKFNIYSIPCLIAFKDGKEIKRNIGLIPKDSVEEMMEEL